MDFLMRMPMILSLFLVVILTLLWIPGSSAQKPFSPYDSTPLSNGSKGLLLKILNAERYAKCLTTGSACNPWDRSAPCCDGTMCRTYSNSNCMGFDDCYCRPSSKIFGFVNWYRK